MALTITITQRKGGAGKTTLSCQLAAALAKTGFRVCGLDLDEQGSFSNWARRRSRRDNAPDVELHHIGLFNLSTALWGVRSRADVVLIDTPPRSDGIVKEAVRAADLAIVPLQLSPLDLDATMPTARLIGAEGTPTLFVVNRAPPRARVADIIRAEIKRQGLELAASELGNRAAFSESLALGYGVVESAPTSRAAHEIRALAAEITGRVKKLQAA